MKIFKKLLRLIIIGYHKTINWFLLSKKGSDFYITIRDKKFILGYQNKLENHNLKKYFTKSKEFLVLDHVAKKLIGAYKFSDELKDSILIYFDKNGRPHCLMHNYKNGFEPISDYEKIIHLNTKKILKDSFTHQIYILEMI